MTTIAKPQFDEVLIRQELAALGVNVEQGPIQFEELTHNRLNQITEGVWRVRAGGFEAVLKTVVNRPGGDIHWQPSTTPTAWNYWRREAEVYSTGLNASYSQCGLRGPRTLQVVERDHATVAIWMEAVQGNAGPQIDDLLLSELSYRLGQAQGAWSVESRPLPPWASRHFLRDYTESKSLGWALLDSDDGWSRHLVAKCFPNELREGANRLHRDREWLLAVMEECPRTFAHLDVWPNNVIFADNGDHVLVDWAFAGDGALGEDIGNLIPDAVFDRFVRAERMSALADLALERYLEGLSDAGWNGDERLVRLAFHASAVKYDWLVPLSLERADQQQLDYGGLDPVDPEDRYRERGLAMLELVRWAEEARRMLRRTPSLLPGVDL
jgi:hypothetical protein